MTATAFAVGAVGAGAGTGAAAGAVGSLLPEVAGWRGLALAAVLSVTMLFDATALGGRLPTSRRQVNEDWLGRYRGWVYGVAFGAQLGVGVVTIVSSAAIYATIAAEFLSAGVAPGAVIGGMFGAVRALSLLSARIARSREDLLRLHRRLGGLEPGVRHAVALLELLAILAVVGWTG
ncbi:MAG: hypothetical protein ACYC91_18565 [Solirubrobacteraceae bacterium]